MDLDDSAFVEDVESAYKLACCAGNSVAIATANDKSLRSRDISPSPAFYTACHDGFQGAQERVLAMLMDLEETKRDLTSSQKAARRERRTDISRELQCALGAIGDREFILRNIVDAVAWQIIGFDIQFAKKLHDAGEPAGPVSGTNYEATLRVSQEHREGHPLRFALINDLTTFVHAGDCLTVEQRDDGRKFEIVEVKGGLKNEQLGDFLGFALESNLACPRSVAFFVKEHGERGIDQFLRMAKQGVSLSKAVQSLSNRDVLDLNLGAPLQGPDTPFHLASYDECLGHYIGRAIDGRVEVARYDECLYILATGGADDGSALGRATQHCTATVRADLWDSFRRPLALPIFLRQISAVTKMQLTFGTAEVRLCLDLHAFGSIAKRRGLGVELLSRRQTAEAQPAIPRAYTVDGRAMAFRSGARRFVVGDGLLSRIFFQGVTPEAALDLVEGALAIDPTKAS